MGLDQGCGGQQGQSADEVEVVTLPAEVSGDYRKPDGSNSSASESAGLGCRAESSDLIGFYSFK